VNIGTRVRFKRYGRPFIGRVVQDDPGQDRAKVRVETAHEDGPSGLSMTTAWFPYDALEVVND
jgi:hypothetical protein